MENLISHVLLACMISNFWMNGKTFSLTRCAGAVALVAMLEARRKTFFFYNSTIISDSSRITVIQYLTKTAALNVRRAVK
jgi:hypothetical protein